jgi:PAS domain S-box-containing protein
LLRIAGCSEEDLTRGISISEFFDKDDRERIEQNIRKRMTGEGAGAGNEYTLRRRDGTVSHVLAYSSAIEREGKVIGIRGAVVDITERKKIEQQMIAQNQMMNALLSNMPIFTARIDEDGIITEARGAGLKSLGLSEGEIVGVNVFSAYPEGEEQLRRVLSGGTSQFEFQVEREDRTMYFDAYAFFDSERGKGAIGFVIDVTDRKQTEAILREAQRLAAIGETAAMVGHDLRNPLQAVALAAYLAREELAAGNTRNLRDRLGLIETQVEYMNKVVWDLQDYVRPITPALERTDLRPLLNRVLSTVSIPDRIAVEVDLDADLPEMLVDPALMQRSLANLITNSIEAMPRGGKLTISGRRTPTAVQIVVRDTGVGLSKEVMQRLFSPLFTTKPKGMGFGLPICKRIVEAHGGSISAEGEPGKGSAFTVTLPLKRLDWTRGTTQRHKGEPA